MNIALIDDETLHLNNLQKLLSNVLSNLGFDSQRICSFSSGSEFFASWQPGQYDVIILDIYMEQMDGIEAARKIRQEDADAALVFCSSSNEFASESYELNASYYLTKPVTLERLNAMVQRLNFKKLEYDRKLRLPDGYLCRLRNLVYTEYFNHCVTFYMMGESAHSIYMSQANAEALLLPLKHFYCVNKGCIVNFSMVRKLTDNSFLMKDGKQIPIARRRYKEIADAYTYFHFEQLDREVSD